MTVTTEFAARRIAARTAQLDAIAVAAEGHGATALHLIGSLGRGTADAWSDVDVWLTFPDDAIDDAVRRRFDLYGEVGDVLLFHEAAQNRPVGGVYSFVLYQTPAGPMVVDWSLAPQRTSRIKPPVVTVYERMPVPHGERQIDLDAQQETSLDERVAWLVCMLFVAVKMIARGEESAFLGFLGEAYRCVGDEYRLERLAVTDPVSLVNVGTMLRQIAPYADARQRRAIDAIDGFLGIIIVDEDHDADHASPIARTLEDVFGSVPALSGRPETVDFEDQIEEAMDAEAGRIVRGLEGR